MSLDQPNNFVKHQTVTRDAFLGGRLTLSQPRHGFRAGLDSVLLGAAVRNGSGRLLDMGCGVGTAAFVALTHHGGLAASLLDQNEEMLALATANAEANQLAARVTTIAGDVIALGAQRRAAGLADNAFSTVIANPPFFEDGAGTLARDGGRAAARHMDAEALDLWVRTAASSASGGGEIIFIYPAETIGPLLAAFSQRFGGITILPLSPRPNGVSSRVLIRAVKGSRAPLKLLASRPMHASEGRDFQPEFDAIFRGTARLDW